MWPFALIKGWIADFINRRRHFTAEEWKDLILLTKSVDGKQIGSDKMKVVLEYPKKEEEEK